MDRRAREQEDRSRRQRRGHPLLVVLAVMALLVAARLAAPALVRDAILQRLSGLGAVSIGGDVDVELLDGRCSAQDLRITSTVGGHQVVVEAPRAEFALPWAGLVGVGTDIHLIRPRAVVTQGPRAVATQGGPRSPKTGQADAPSSSAAAPDDDADQAGAEPGSASSAGPLSGLSRASISDGTVIWRRPLGTPDLVISNLRFRYRREPEQAFVDLQALIAVRGQIRVHGTIDPARPLREFDLGVMIQELPLAAIDPWLRAATGVDTEAGVLDAYAEVRAIDGRLSGYVKPLAHGVDVLDVADEFRNQGLGDLLMEVGAAAGLEALENEQGVVASRIPIDGNVETPGVDGTAAVGSALRNAFVEAVEPGFISDPATAPTASLRVSAAMTPGGRDRYRLLAEVLVPPGQGLHLVPGIAADHADDAARALTIQIGCGYGLGVLDDRLSMGVMPFIGGGVSRRDDTVALFTYGVDAMAGWHLGRLGFGLRGSWVGRDAAGGDQDGDDALLGAWVDWRLE